MSEPVSAELAVPEELLDVQTGELLGKSYGNRLRCAACGHFVTAASLADHLSSECPLRHSVRATVEERFWGKVTVGDPAECWPWLGHVKGNGYGQFVLRHGVPVGAHRIAYELRKGPIPEGLQIDHTCHDRSCPGGRSCAHRRCVNPAHLEAVTIAENLRRGHGSAAAGAATAAVLAAQTHCKRGHEFTPENTRHYQGKRCCRACGALLQRNRRAERKAV